MSPTAIVPNVDVVKSAGRFDVTKRMLGSEDGCIVTLFAHAPLGCLGNVALHVSSESCKLSIRESRTACCVRLDGVIRISCPECIDSDDVVIVDIVSNTSDDVIDDDLNILAMGEIADSDNCDDTVVTFWYDLALYKCGGARGPCSRPRTTASHHTGQCTDQSTFR